MSDFASLQLLPLGVGHDQEGCCYWVELGSARFLLECGLKDPSLLDHLPQAPDFVVCSHAHADHSQALPYFHQLYPEVPIYSTRTTYHLAMGLWDAGHPQTLDFPALRCIPFNRAAVVQPDLTLSFFRAGHLPGAAVTVLQYVDTSVQTLIYTGDCSLASTRFTDGIDLEALRHWQPSTLIIEGSLGPTRYPSRRHQESRLVERIAAALATNACVIVPVPSVGLSQELIFLLKTHHRFTQAGSPVTVWVDPLIGQGCDLYLPLISEFPQSVQNFAQHQALFWESRISPRVCPLPQSADELLKILTAPGIILWNADVNLSTWQERWQVLEQVVTSSALAWIQCPEVKLPLSWDQWPESLQQNLQIERVNWHTHSDYNNLIQIIHTLKPQHVVFVHGDFEALTQLATVSELCSRYHLHCPTPQQFLDLPSAPLHQFYTEPDPALTDSRYEGEVEEVLSRTSPFKPHVQTVQILLPGEITSDPRWSTWADTGLIEARWQGQELILRGLTPRELVKPVTPDLVDTTGIQRVEACRTCQFLQITSGSGPSEYRCGQPRSPLFQKQIHLNGYCLDYSPIPLDKPQVP